MRHIRKYKVKHKDFIDWINNYEKLTFRHLFFIASRIKISVLIALLGIFSGYSFLVFQLATKKQVDTIGIALGKPFNMSIKDLDLDISGAPRKPDGALDSEQLEIDLQEIHLVYDEERVGLTDDEIRLDIRKVIKDEVDKPVKRIGTILAKKADRVSVPWQPWIMKKVQILEPALAQQSFDWHGREDNFDFYERKIDETTIRRYYYDCWILEYKIDSNGDSIDDSFVWIEKGASLLGYCF